mgnify:CR=1 FL=1
MERELKEELRTSFALIVMIALIGALAYGLAQAEQETAWAELEAQQAAP